MITTLREAEEALAEAMNDYTADTGQPGDSVWYDLVVATAMNILLEDSEGADLAREFCRTQIGIIPHDLEPYLGKADRIEAKP